jgi:MFS-type transporter involved in bile tolerance (Atg22 family)
MIGLAIVLALIAAAFDGYIGIKEPWRKMIYIGIVVLFVAGILALLGLLPNFGPLFRY